MIHTMMMTTSMNMISMLLSILMILFIQSMIMTTVKPSAEQVLPNILLVYDANTLRETLL